jgi:hypothetical protein
VYVLLALVEEAELRALVGVYDGKDTSDALANVMDASELGGSSGDLARPERNQLAENRQQFVRAMSVSSSGRPTSSAPATASEARPCSCSTAVGSSAAVVSTSSRDSSAGTYDFGSRL